MPLVVPVQPAGIAVPVGWLLFLQSDEKYVFLRRTIENIIID